jgi:cobalt transporter subunit CbtB
LLPAFFAAMFGGVLLGVIGFAPIEVVHNAAHDTRHAVAFPCH